MDIVFASVSADDTITYEPCFNSGVPKFSKAGFLNGFERYFECFVSVSLEVISVSVILNSDFNPNVFPGSKLLVAAKIIVCDFCESIW